ncbi:hypothetical protein CBL_09648 [Carabus blaptoides fortunei]
MMKLKGKFYLTTRKRNLIKWREVQEFTNPHYPNSAEANRINDLYSDTLAHYLQQVSKKREIQTTLERFFKKKAAKKQRMEQEDLTLQASADSPKSESQGRRKKQKSKKYLQTKEAEDFEEYKKQRKTTEDKIKKCKEKAWEEFGETMEENFKENQKLFY